MGALHGGMPVFRLAVLHGVSPDRPLLQTVVPSELSSLHTSSHDLGPPPHRKLLQCCSLGCSSMNVNPFYPTASHYCCYQSRAQVV